MNRKALLSNSSRTSTDDGMGMVRMDLDISSFITCSEASDASVLL